MDPSTKKRFVRVYVADTGNDFLVEQKGLNCPPRASLRCSAKGLGGKLVA
jgi:hypothetical protein